MNTKGERKIMNLDNIKYVIAQKYYRHKEDYCFVKTLAHEFEGENEVIGYLPLKDALHFNTKKEAEDALKTQPKWVREKHIAIPFEKSKFNNYYLLNNDDMEVLPVELKRGMSL